MSKLVRENYTLACEGFMNMDDTNKRKIDENENLINWLNHNITDFVVTITSRNLNGDVSEYLGKIFHVVSDLERIGDHAVNVIDRTVQAKEEDLDFTKEGLAEFEEIYNESLELFDRSMDAFVNKHLTDAEGNELHFIMHSIQDLTVQAQDNHVQRLREKKCHTASGVVFTKVLQDLERVGAHSYNIAWAARKDKALIRQI
jgi:phosphate:Na+ symporter